jgi:integrase
VLPEPSQPRKGYFKTRDEAARFIWKAWRKRHKRTGEYAWRHVARYTLVGLYSGSRNGDICKAALMPTIGRGYVDVETGIFKRKPDNKKETSKKQPTVPIHPKLLAHIRRWKRKGIARTSVIEFRGKPVGVVKEAWRTVAEDAGFPVDKHDPGKIIRHSARHTAITWYLTGLHNREQPVKRKGRRPGKGVDIEVVSQYCGVSVKVIREHYRHETAGTYDELLGTGSA